MNYQFSIIEAKIFDVLKNTSYDQPIVSREIQKRTGIDNRMLAATVREMNEKFKGEFHIGSAKDKGYWYCRNEREAIASYLAYNKTILSSLGERSRIKEQIRLTFEKQKNLFGEPIRIDQNIKSEALREKKRALHNPFLEH